MARVEKGMTRWLKMRKLIDERPIEERSGEAPELTPLEACMQLSLFGGTFLRDVEEDGDEHRRGKQSPWTGEVRGFNIHAGVLIHKGDREGLERLQVRRASAVQPRAPARSCPTTASPTD